MAAYNSDPTTACAQTFDQAALEQSFPDSTAARESRASLPRLPRLIPLCFPVEGTLADLGFPFDSLDLRPGLWPDRQRWRGLCRRHSRCVSSPYSPD